MSDSQLKSQVLLDQMSYLCEELGDPGRYFPYLRSKRVLDDGDCERIRAQVTSQAKTETFVEIITRGRESKTGEHSFDVLAEALKKARVQAHIARQLQKALAKLKVDRQKEKGIDTRQTTSPPARNGGVGLHLAATESSVSSSSSVGAGSSSDVHPLHGLLPPMPPHNPKVTAVEFPPQNEHPEYGPLPPDLAPISSRGTVDPQQVTNDSTGAIETGRFPPTALAGKMAEFEPGPQSQPSDLEYPSSIEMSMNTTTTESQTQLTSGFTLGSSSSALSSMPESTVVEGLQREVERLKQENVELRQRNRHLENLVRNKAPSPTLAVRHAPYEDHRRLPPHSLTAAPLHSLTAPPHYSPLGSRGGLMDKRLSASSGELGGECSSAHSGSSIASYGTQPASESLV